MKMEGDGRPIFAVDQEYCLNCGLPLTEERNFSCGCTREGQIRGWIPNPLVRVGKRG